MSLDATSSGSNDLSSPGSSDQSVSTSADSTAANGLNTADSDFLTPDTPSDTGSDLPADTGDPWAEFDKPSENQADAASEGEKPAETAEKDASATDQDAKPEEKPGEKPADKSDDADAELDDVFAEDKDSAETPEGDKLTEAQLQALRPAARAAARRNEKRAEIVKDFQFSDKPITEILGKFEELNPTRYNELRTEAAHSLVDTNPDATFARAYVIKMKQKDPNFDYTKAEIPTLDDIISGRFSNSADDKTGAGGAVGAAVQSQQSVEDVAEQLSKTLDFDWRDEKNDDLFDPEQLVMIKTIRALESKRAETEAEKTQQTAELQKLQARINEIDGTIKSEVQTKFENTYKETITDYRTQFEGKFIPRIAKEVGLEVTDDDTPAIKAFKQRKLELYTGTPFERAAGEYSMFENFAYNHSKVAAELTEVTKRIIDAVQNEAQAKVANKTQDAIRFRQSANDEQIALARLLRQANQEFAPAYVTPDLELFEVKGAALANHINESSQRVEIAGSAANAAPAAEPEVEYDTAEDLWNGMVADHVKSVTQRRV